MIVLQLTSEPIGSRISSSNRHKHIYHPDVVRIKFKNQTENFGGEDKDKQGEKANEGKLKRKSVCLEACNLVYSL